MKYADAYVSLLLLIGNGSIIIFNRNKEEFKDYYDKIWKDIDFHV